ncbi:tetratricopeptide repeat-containing glycosyltransferase family 2 protein [Paenibacillus soyae]|uniref:Glycosyltransferase family 2 protein n=1 Tax=Paenibacillus soyae TaxID=2969249 RepID=A0A9X2SCQ8_9BACL|nr:glycosyltransferase family 2 protein [Paenibacillus soyae]MCR2806392.1 glycosyltransferase family 2 protein [Paenibacillus soyae]
MVSITLCLIVRNEQSALGNCLESVKDAVDEIVIVDTGSTDDTRALAGRYTNNVYDFEWIDDFAAARNFCFSLATSDYILWLDADDVLLEEDRRKLLRLKSELDPAVDAISMIYHYAFDEYGNVTLSLRRNRLVKRANGFRWHGPVHEYLAVSGRVMNSDIVVTHRRTHGQSARNLTIFENRKGRGEIFSPRDLYYYANELLDHGMWERAAAEYESFLRTGQGWAEDAISACVKLSDIYERLMLPEKQLASLWRSFDYGEPRAESCCRLGAYFLSRSRTEEAAFWYRLATRLEKPKDCLGFLHDAYWTWVPHLQLCLCYSRAGDFAKAYFHNEMAGRYRPDDPHVRHNRTYLEGMLRNEAL